jgi:hypothetical protein
VIEASINQHYKRDARCTDPTADTLGQVTDEFQIGGPAADHPC